MKQNYVFVAVCYFVDQFSTLTLRGFRWHYPRVVAPLSRQQVRGDRSLRTYLNVADLSMRYDRNRFFTDGIYRWGRKAIWTFLNVGNGEWTESLSCSIKTERLVFTRQEIGVFLKHLGTSTITVTSLCGQEEEHKQIQMGISQVGHAVRFQSQKPICYGTKQRSLM